MLPPRLALLDGLFGSQRALRKDLVPLVEPGLDGVDVVVQVDAQRRELGNDGGRLVLRRLAVRLDDVRRGDAAAQLLREQLGDLGLVELEVDLPDDGAEVGGAEALEQRPPPGALSGWPSSSASMVRSSKARSISALSAAMMSC